MRDPQNRTAKSRCATQHQIHNVTGELETRVKERFPQIARVTIHPEPVEER
jgi:divalent metal cation (Fe/Co/Zn/Cd) transporter